MELRSDGSAPSASSATPRPAPVGRGCLGSLTTRSEGGSHGPTDDRPPLAGLGGRPPGLRADAGQRVPGAGASRGRMPRSSSATCITRSARSTSRAGKTGLAHFVEHMLFKGTERFPKGQIDRLAFVAAGHSNAETGEDCDPLLVRLPVRPLGACPGDRGRPDAGGDLRPARGRGRAACHRRGARPRPRFARSAGSTRPTWPSPTCGTPIATRSWAGPTTWRGSRSTTSGRSTTATTAPTARVLVDRRRRRPRAGVRPGRGALRRDPAGDRAAVGAGVDRAAADGPARLHAGRSRIGGAGPVRLAHRARAAIPTARRSTSCPTC